jgi:hypothetical protein
MPPPLETSKTTGSIGVDNEISLLSSPPKSTEQQQQTDQQAMDLFLNQVAEYNAQQLSFDQHTQQQQVSSSNDLGK